MVIFSEWLFYALATAGVFLLRRKEPNLPRPYRTRGYPWVPASFVVVASVLLVYTFRQNLRESLMGLGLTLAGLPLYWFWRRRGRAL
jgi:APA family basic amino acid/polyamine antiporter